MTRKVHFGDTVTGWACKYRHPLGHEYVIVAPTKAALAVILAAGLDPRIVWREEWVRRAQVVKPLAVVKHRVDTNHRHKKSPSAPARSRN